MYYWEISSNHQWHSEVIQFTTISSLPHIYIPHPISSPDLRTLSPLHPISLLPHLFLTPFSSLPHLLIPSPRFPISSLPHLLLRPYPCQSF